MRTIFSQSVLDWRYCTYIFPLHKRQSRVSKSPTATFTRAQFTRSFHARVALFEKHAETRRWVDTAPGNARALFSDGWLEVSRVRVVSGNMGVKGRKVWRGVNDFLLTFPCLLSTSLFGSFMRKKNSFKVHHFHLMDDKHIVWIAYLCFNDVP